MLRKSENHTDRSEWRTDVGRISAVFNISDDHYVNVSMKLWQVKDNVKIKANYSGTPAKGYQVDKITTTPETISIAGSEEALKTGGQWKYSGDSW